MATDNGSRQQPVRFQFRLRTVLIIVTAFAVFLGIFAMIIPDNLPIELRAITFAVISVPFAFAVWVCYRSSRHPWKSPENFVLVRVDSKWQRRAKSPFVFLPIMALTGVSTTFAPMYLLYCGQMQEFGLLEWILVPLSLAVIYLVPNFYVNLAGEVIAELVRSNREGASATPGGEMNNAIQKQSS
jgi:hypothetical protein